MSQTGLGGQNSIIGTVFGPDGRPLENRVRIRLATMTSGDRISTSSETGSFAFKGLPTGTYTIVIDKEKEYEPYAQSVDLRQFRGAPPQVYTMNIRLVSKARAEAKPGVLNAEFANVPQGARASYERAIELAGKGDRLGAVEQLRVAIQEDPKFTLAHNEMGVQYLRLN
ncbi:MAG: carboxypeptidase-like regulatory domain-containing protein, partial [Pyrinomonadaceae bacterium]